MVTPALERGHKPFAIQTFRNLVLIPVQHVSPVETAITAIAFMIAVVISCQGKFILGVSLPFLGVSEFQESTGVRLHHSHFGSGGGHPIRGIRRPAI